MTLPSELATRIATMSEGNLRRAILIAEASRARHGTLTANTPLELPDWEEFIVQLAKEIAEEQSPRRLQAVRAKLYELLSHCIPPEIIFKVLLSTVE